MKWVTKDCQGNQKVWYSEDTILRIREKATAGVIGYEYGAQNEYHSCQEILNFLNEVEK